MTSRIPLPDSLVNEPFTVAEARQRGVTDKRLRGGDLQRPFRGVRSVAGLTTVDALTRAALRRLPSRAFVWGPTAAVLQRIPLPLEVERSMVIHVAVPAPHRAPTGRGLRGHRVASRSDELCIWAGLRMTVPERTWCDLGSSLELDELVAAGDFVIARGRPLVSLSRLAEAVAAYPSRRGIRSLRAALPLLDDGSESPAESRLRLIIVRARFRGWVTNHEVVTRGEFHYRLDLAFPHEKVALEYQGDYHRDPRQFRRDMTRIDRLQADGWYVMQVNADDLKNPLELIERIRGVLAARRHT